MSRFDQGEEDLSLPLDPNMLRRRKNRQPTAEVPQALSVDRPRHIKQTRLVERTVQAAADVIA